MTESASTCDSPGAFSCWSVSKRELRKLVESRLDFLRSVDRRLHVLAGPVDADAVRLQVDDLFERFPDPDRRPPLFGVPVGIKDIIRVEGVSIRCGSLLPPVLFEGPEAQCVRMLREAGAVIFAQTATTEFAYFEPAATRNPHNPGHTPGGSSSGSAAGVAAGAFPLALGTQTAGSVIRPASFCGVVGVKPSLGRIPTDGIVYFSRSVDHVGFFCRRVAEVSPVMRAFDPGWELPAKPGRLKAGVPDGPYLEQVPGDGLERFRKVLALLEAGGIEIEWVGCLKDYGEIAARHRELMAAEFAAEQKGLFPEYEHLYRPGTAEIIRRGWSIPRERVIEARQSCGDLRRRLDALMREHGLDLWLSPSTLGEAPAGFGSTGSPAMNIPWTHAGVPVISLPCGCGPRGLPLGLQCAGRYGEDNRLAVAAGIIEELLQGGTGK